MRKNRTPTFKDLIEGNVTEEERVVFELQLRPLGEKIIAAFNDVRDAFKGLDMQPFAAAYMRFVEFTDTSEAEANALLDLEHKSFPEAAAYIRDHPPSAGAIAFLIDITRNRFKTQQARENAFKKVAKNLPAKEFVIAEWRKDRGGCKSKAEFSTLYARRVKIEFERDVTARTIARDWLPKD